MSLPRFFLESQVLDTEKNEEIDLRLTDDDLKHARALRLKPQEHIAVIDASMDYFECKIISFSNAIMKVSITTKQKADVSGPSVVLVQGIAKGAKMDSIIRHATELGVAAFIPFESARSIVKLDEKKALVRVERWREIAKSAAMQSGRSFVPEVSMPMKLNEVCAFVSSGAAVLICWEEELDMSLKTALHNALAQQSIHPEDARIAIVVGPEGGLQEAEVKALCASNPYASTISLGRTILRTETAALIAPALALHELGGL